MSSQDLNNIAVFLNNNWGTIILILSGLWAYIVRLDPILKRIPIAAAVTNIVNALQQTVATPGQRFADADAQLAKEFPRMTLAERKLWIEARVALSKVASGTPFDQLPPAAPTEPTVDMAALFTKAFQDAAPAIEQMLEQKVADLRKAPTPAKPRSATGQFTAGSAPVAVSSPAPVAEAAHPDAS